MNRKYINLPNRKIYLLRFILIISIIASAIILFLLFTTTTHVFTTSVLVLLIWTLIFYLIPLLILYFNYKKVNKDSVLIIRDESISLEDKSTQETFTVNEIEFIELNMSIPLYNKRIRLFFWDEYYYALIKLKNGKILFVTCLLCDKLEEFLPEELFLRKERMFPIIVDTPASASL